MAPQTSSIRIAEVAPRTERRPVTPESDRDFAGVAVGITLGALIWFMVLSLVRITG
jgi:hypothetical protein